MKNELVRKIMKSVSDDCDVVRLLAGANIHRDDLEAGLIDYASRELGGVSSQDFLDDTLCGLMTDPVGMAKVLTQHVSASIKGRKRNLLLFALYNLESTLEDKGGSLCWKRVLTASYCLQLALNQLDSGCETKDMAKHVHAAQLSDIADGILSEAIV